MNVAAQYGQQRGIPTVSLGKHAYALAIAKLTEFNTQLGKTCSAIQQTELETYATPPKSPRRVL